MATNFPSSLDSLTNPQAGDTLANPSHSEQHANANDAIEALQAKVGVNSSAVTTSLDYKVSQLETNAVSSGLVDAKGDLILGTADNTVSRLAVGSDEQVLTADSTTATGVKWGTLNLGSGYKFREKVRFAFSGTLDLTLYPWCRAMGFLVIGGGGGGGGAASPSTGQVSLGGCGGAGGFVEGYLPVESGVTSATITVGNGGSGGYGTLGVAGGNSIFAYSNKTITAFGGNRGFVTTSNSFPVVADSGGDGSSSVSGLYEPNIFNRTDSSRANASTYATSTTFFVASSGGSQYNFGPTCTVTKTPGLRSENGRLLSDGNGKNYGGGGAASWNGPFYSTQDGGNGQPGIVIVYLYE